MPISGFREVGEELERLRQELGELRLKRAHLEGQKSNRKLLEKINQKLELLHQQEKKLLAEWSKDGAA